MSSNNERCEVTGVKRNVIETSKKESFLTKINNALKNSKLKGIKGGRVVIPLILLAMIMLIYVNLQSGSKTITSSSSKSESGTDTVSFTSALDYIQQIEIKLSSVLSSIKNAGETKVMISISGSPELEIAENVEEKKVTTTNGTTVTVVTEPILVEINGKKSPVVLKETLPEINGVIVVSSGASDPKVKLDIITAVKALLGVPSSSIEVFAGV